MNAYVRIQQIVYRLIWTDFNLAPKNENNYILQNIYIINIRLPSLLSWLKIYLTNFVSHFR